MPSSLSGMKAAGAQVRQALISLHPLRRFMHMLRTAEVAGNDDVRRIALRRLVFFVDVFSRTKLLFLTHWRPLITIKRELFDIDGAKHLARRAVDAGCSGASAELTSLDQLGRDVLPWRHVVEETKRDLSAYVKTHILPSKVVLAVPSKALRASPQNRALRMIYSEIISSLESEGVAFEPQAVFCERGSGRTLMWKNCISYHTRGAEIGCLHIKETDQPFHFSIDALGYSGWSEFSQQSLSSLGLDEIDFHAAQEFFDRESERIIRGNISKYEQPPAAEEKLPGEFVFVALQTIDDTVQQLAHLPMLDMLEEVANVCAAHRIAVVVKRHPRCKSRLVARALEIGRANGSFIVSRSSIHALISRACAVCTVNSSVGAEAILHRKPIYVFGRSEYHHVCFRMEAPGDFARYFVPGRTAVPEETLIRFHYSLRKHYSVDSTNMDEARGFIRRKIRRLKRVLETASGALS